MADRDLFDLEMSPGEQPPSGLGDRVLVGIAALVLLGGVAIAVMHAVPDSNATAKATATPQPSPSATPQLVPTPAPPRVATILTPDIELVQPTPQPGFSGWIRSLADLIVRTAPVTDGVASGTLAEGAVAYADQQGEPSDEPGWLHLQDPDGWIASVAGGKQLVQRYQSPNLPGSGWVNSLTAGEHGFAAIVSPASGSSGYLRPAPAVSDDGSLWRSGSIAAFGSWDVNSMAWGPAGWLAVANVSDWNETSRIWVWGSPDAQQWNRLGMMAGLTRDYPNQLTATDRGYLLQTNSQSGSPQAGTFWFSPDGRAWTESTDLRRTPNIGDVRIKGLSTGFYLWDASTQPTSARPFAAYSVDGLRWHQVVGGPDGVNLQLTSVGGRVIAVDADRTSLSARVWSGTVARGQMIWTRQRDAEPAFTGTVVTQLVTQGARAYAFGWDRTTEHALVWSGDGTSWGREELPASFGGIPTLAAAWRGGVVVVGHRPTLRGDNPVFWHVTPGGGWLPEADPIVAAVADPPTDHCPALPTDFLSFTIADTAAEIVCHGDAPTSFRAWSVECNGCNGYPSGDSEPAWLLQPSDNQLYLSATKNTDGNWWNSIVLKPPRKVDRSWLSAWVQLTGHYDDPVAATCHNQPTIDNLMWWSGQQAVVLQCRETFVVTDVKVVSGP